MNAKSSEISWQWPCIGPTAINEGLDSETFDTKAMPHTHTFVREAVQNSLDARLDDTQPVRVSFRFHEGDLAGRSEFLSDLRGKKRRCGLPWPPSWQNGRISWLLIEDFNTTGLTGDLAKRSGDFWNYWLNFGISNKTGSGRGGRGIGRVTFLIASKIHAVVGITRREADDLVAVCGMSVMRMFEDGDDVRSSYAYLAKSERKNTYDLYEDPAFIQALVAGFAITDRTQAANYGFSLAIPFPHEEITSSSIKAAIIEHFAPAIIDGDLVAEVDGVVLSPDTIDTVAFDVAGSFQSDAFREGAVRILDLQRRAIEAPDMTVKVSDLSAFVKNLTEEEHAELRRIFDGRRPLVLDLVVPVVRDGTTFNCQLRAAIAKAPRDCAPADFLFRGGMCLPAASSRRPGDIDLVLQTRGESNLVVYLNFCEGKAHLDLTENHEVSAKLADHGFTEGYSVKRFVRRLMEELRSAVLPDAAKPDPSVFARFFSAPRAPTPSGSKKTRPKRRNVVAVEPPPPRTPIFIVKQLEDGFRVKANPQFTDWPVNARIAIAYADGSRRPKWSRFDFDLKKLGLRCNGSSTPVLKDNVVSVADCGADFELEICGFDTSRELVTNIDPRRAVKATNSDAVDA